MHITLLLLPPGSGPGHYWTKSLKGCSAWPDLLSCDTPDESWNGANGDGQEGRLRPPGDELTRLGSHCSWGKVSLEEKHVKSDHMGALLQNVQRDPVLI